MLRETNWLTGTRRFPSELPLPSATRLIRAETRVETKAAIRTETRYFVSSRPLTPTDAAAAVREHGAIENRLHWVLDVTFNDDQSHLRNGHGASEADPRRATTSALPIDWNGTWRTVAA